MLWLRWEARRADDLSQRPFLPLLGTHGDPHALVVTAWRETGRIPRRIYPNCALYRAKSYPEVCWNERE